MWYYGITQDCVYLADVLPERLVISRGIFQFCFLSSTVSEFFIFSLLRRVIFGVVRKVVQNSLKQSHQLGSLGRR